MKSPRFDEALGHGLSDKRIDILRGIRASGSISQAAREASVSYKAAWQAIDTLTNLAGVPLVHRAVGGSGGGGASLTVHGLQLLELAGELDAARAQVQQRWHAAAGAAAGASELSGSSPFALRTSMRNQLPASVTAIESAGPLSRATLRIGEDGTLCARLTRESVELLGLRPAARVIALCKATSVRVMRAGDAPAGGKSGGGAVNLMRGKVAGVERGSQGDEVRLALPGGGHVVGFAPAGSALRVRQLVVAQVDESAVVLALPG